MCAAHEKPNGMETSSLSHHYGIRVSAFRAIHIHMGIVFHIAEL